MSTFKPAARKVAGPRPIHRLLPGAMPGLAALREHAACLARINRIIGRELSAPLNAHCRAVNLRDGLLVVETDSGAWATRIRFIGPRLLDALRAAGLSPAATDLAVRVGLTQDAPRLAGPGRPPCDELSDSARRALMDFALHCPHPELSEATASFAVCVAPEAETHPHSIRSGNDKR